MRQAFPVYKVQQCFQQGPDAGVQRVALPTGRKVHVEVHVMKKGCLHVVAGDVPEAPVVRQQATNDMHGLNA